MGIASPACVLFGARYRAPLMFELLGRDGMTKARRGRLRTAHGTIETPAFMPVGTQGTVKAVSPDELKTLRAQIILGNTYHLFVRPGIEVLQHCGGLHAFCAWDGPILTDSGGYQVFSLARLRKITDEGVHFQNHLDGTPCFLGPREAMQIQAVLGSDIAMVFDECPPYPCDYEYAARSLDRTLAWARVCKESSVSIQQTFGIVQGSIFPELRRTSAEALVTIGFDGYAIGGVSVGEPEPEMMAGVESSEPYLPADKPRYAMGLGTPPQLIELVARGVDLFDCVLPTRLARNGTAFTAAGTINLKNAQFALDTGAIEEGCACPACRQFTRAYVRHLLKAEEILGLRLVTLHNLHFYLDLMKRARNAITDGSFAAFRARLAAEYAVRERTVELG